jgi:hypothetical protein
MARPATKRVKRGQLWPRPLPKFKPVSAEIKSAQARKLAIEIDAACESRELTTLLPPPPNENHRDRKEWEALDSQITSEMTDRLMVLLNHYRIDSRESGAFLRLALAMAIDLIPNFNIAPSRPGRKRGREKPAGMLLCEAVDKIASERDKGIGDACRQLVKRPGPWRDGNPNTLETRYHEEIKRLRDEVHNELAGQIARGEIDISRYRNGGA